MNPFIHLDAMYKLTNTYKKTKQAVEEMHEVAMTVNISMGLIINALKKTISPIKGFPSQEK